MNLRLFDAHSLTRRQFLAVADKVTVRDLQATILHLLGFHPYKFHYRYQGLNQRLIGPTNEGKIVKGILA